MPKRRKKHSKQPQQQSSALPWFMPLSEPVRPLTREEIANLRREERGEGRDEASEKARASAAKSKQERRQTILTIIQEEEARATDTKRDLLDRVNLRLIDLQLEPIKAPSTLYRWRSEVRKLRK
jgi:hypothetical protein